ncbi:hypothetical protein WG66_015256 [Moniliophthora roreri]|nr:hypothetical protein WG66_015256 [Moniliophthora roreri]
MLRRSGNAIKEEIEPLSDVRQIGYPEDNTSLLERGSKSPGRMIFWTGNTQVARENDIHTQACK